MPFTDPVPSRINQYHQVPTIAVAQLTDLNLVLVIVYRICFSEDWKNFFFMKVISELPSFMPANGFFPSKTKSSYLILPAGCIPT